MRYLGAHFVIFTMQSVWATINKNHINFSVLSLVANTKSLVAVTEIVRFSKIEAVVTQILIGESSRERLICFVSGFHLQIYPPSLTHLFCSEDASHSSSVPTIRYNIA